MQNAVLHLISNKSGDFNVPCFPSYSDFTPYTATAAETLIRNKLFINESRYHLINSMLAVYAFMDIYSEFRESARTFDFQNLPNNFLTITGASYANTDTVNFNILNIPTTFPSPDYFNWEIKYQDEEFLVFVGCDTNFTIPYTLATVTQDSVDYRLITAEWPEVSGIKGGFILDADVDWSYGNSFTLSVYPVSFPYDAAITYINKFSETSQILTAAGLSRNYYNAQSAIEKYALLMLALARPDLRNPDSGQDCSV